MSLVATYSFGSASAARYSTVNELLLQLPDNSANLINASDIRDSVFSLWEFIDDVSVVAYQASSASSYFTNPNQVPYTVGGITAGMSFSGTFSMQQMWDMLLYPYVAPGASLANIANRQYGASTAVTLSWSVVKNSNPITSIIVDGLAIVPTGNSQTGVKAAIATHSATPGIFEINTFTMSCSDGTTTTTDTTTLTYMNRRYWGSLDLSGIGNPDLSLNPGSASAVTAVIDMNTPYLPGNTITTLSGAGVGSGSELAITKNKTYTNINGGGNYLIFAFPTSFGTPTFTVNGLPNTAFTKVVSNTALNNEQNFSGTNYDVWLSNTTQSSPLLIVIS